MRLSNFSFSKIASTPSVTLFVRFFVVGVFSALIEMTILIVLVEWIFWDYLTANIVAFTLTNIFNYFLSRNWVFTSDNNKMLAEFSKFMVFVLIGLLVNQFFLWVFVEYFSIDYKISKLLSIGLTVIWNFITRKHLIFRSETLSKKSEL